MSKLVFAHNSISSHLSKKFFFGKMPPNSSVVACKENSVDPKDVAHFSSFAEKWWDLDGPVNSLHPFNDVRVPFVRNGLKKTGRCKVNNLNGLKILDVGCGVGIFSEGLAKDGAVVVGIDPAEKLIEVARNHLVQTKKSHPSLNVTYLCELVQDHAIEHEGEYDAVVASEVVEVMKVERIRVDILCNFTYFLSFTACSRC